jgi:hypothetical protein
MTDNRIADRSAAFEQLIFQVRGIQAARVVTDSSGQIDEVHVVGSPSRSPKQMVRDIESILYVRGGIRLDHRKVSLVQLTDSPPPRATVRLQLRSVAQDRSPHGPQTTVTLALGERAVEGVCLVEQESEEHVIRAAAGATVLALGQLIGPGGELHLEQVMRQPFGALPVCLSHLTLSTDRGIETLLGISVIRNDAAGAAARSVLDAVNRRINWLLGIE